jgi:hypothetical protein
MHILDEVNNVQLFRTTDGRQYVYGTRIIGVAGSMRLWGNYSAAETAFLRIAG